ncbi:glutathione peroxidase [Alicyclobacillus dauci]|uniref:Glutathione peroxidase n=1 Tax=Alicyclobacillus dauci TaxID=1475485 RepID=A0ABY6Z8B2_9BACL|nr:glutathione peroxidase [Alicyclobacillus dauci]WAH39132.1 glutathione peroxidase [Alicyclobacillus dauci]
MTVYDFHAATSTGEVQSLQAYKGQVLLIVNTASRCGFTPQYAGLQQLQTTYASRGFSVLGFPCNQFAGQEPGSSEEIQTFCRDRYGVTFPVFAKVKVNGHDAHPLYRFLKKECPGFAGSEMIKWNFTKFLVSPQGRVVKRYPPTVSPKDIVPDIETLLGTSN